MEESYCLKFRMELCEVVKVYSEKGINLSFTGQKVFLVSGALGSVKKKSLTYSNF